MKRRLSVIIALILAIAMLFSSCDTPAEDNTGSDGTSDTGTVDGGNTDGGNTDSGNTDGGNTDGGNTDGGNTDSGNTDGGNTDGGNTDGGNTDSGNTDGGNTDGGNTDSGNTDGGNTDGGNTDGEVTLEVPALTRPAFNLSAIPGYNGKDKELKLNDGNPYFTANQYAKEAYEYYSELDSLGRCGVAVALLGSELMPGPDDNRGSMSGVSPSGWHSGGIYERSHLIAYALANEQANAKNLISGTYDLNGIMQTYEELVLDYIKETGNHVLYRVEPIFSGDNLLATGVIMEAYSIEDEGEGICFNVFIYNVQDDCTIDYATGDFELDVADCKYILNTKSKKIHKPDCSGVHDMSEKNKQETDKSLEELIEEGYSPCGTCKPDKE